MSPSYDDEYEEPIVCPACGGPAGLLGTLGRREHFLCRNCGMQFSRLVEPEEVDHDHQS